MRKELANKQIYNDFISKTILSEVEEEVLIKYIRNESIVKMSDDLCLGTATVSRIIASIKIKYENYKKLEIAKIELFK